MLLGTAAKSEEGLAAELNQVDILILRKIKQLSYRKAVDYIRYNMSMPGKNTRYTTYVGTSGSADGSPR